METSMVISSSEDINIPMESTLSSGSEHLHKDAMEVDGGMLQSSTDSMEVQTTQSGIDHGKTLTWEDVAAEIASTEETHESVEETHQNIEKGVVMQHEHTIIGEEHYAEPIHESVVQGDVSDYYVEEKVDESSTSSENVVQECLVESNNESEVAGVEEMAVGEHVTEYVESEANPCDSVNGGDEVKIEEPDSSNHQVTAAICTVQDHDAVYQQVHEAMEVVHETEVHETEVLHDTEVHETQVHEVHEAEVHETEVHETEVHETEVHETEVHETEVHESEVHDTEVHGTEVHGTEVDGTEVHGTEVDGTEVVHETVHEAQVHETEVVHESELIPGTEIVHGVRVMGSELVQQPEQQLAEYMVEQHTNEEQISEVNNSMESVDSSQNQVEEEEEVEDTSHVYMEEVYVLPNEDDVAAIENIGEVAVLEKPKKPRGRKPTTEIPLHVLGRDINKPGVTSTNGGRSMPKPRLGVKVPYRNLTSQIVSKEDIQKEIMDRYKQKQEQNVTPAGDIFFARKLTHRLAKKLTPSDNKDGEQKQSTSSAKNAPAAAEVKPEVVSVVRVIRPDRKIDSGLIKDNSDLLAILEGDGDDLQDPLNPKAKTYAEKEKKTENFVKDIEKEIALQQLKELPLTKNKIFRSKTHDNVEQAESPPTPTPMPKQKTESVKQPDKRHDDNDPPLKTGVVVKTYTRKRKSMEPEPDFVPSKKSLLAAAAVTNEVELNDDNTPCYVTKSSRVIKRKVIWDPDEVSTPKSYFKTPKLSVATPVKQPQTPQKITPVAKSTAIPKLSKNNASPKTNAAPKITAKAVEKKADDKKTEDKKVEDKKVEEKKVEGKKVEEKKSVEKKSAEKRGDEKKITEKKVDEKKTAEKKVDEKKGVEKKVVVEKKTVVEKKGDVKKTEEKKTPVVEKKVASPAMKKPIGSPAKGGSALKKQKRLTEIDKLLMDEGAVNMLYDVNNTDSPDKLKKKNKSVISLDREHRVLMNKASMLKNELQQTSNETSTPKSLRKKVDMTPSPKEPVVPSNIAKRQKSKDSIGSKSSPPMSPASFSPAEASRIIRRHSSSSFSSGNEVEEEGTAAVVEPKKRLGRPPKVAKKSVESKKEAPAPAPAKTAAPVAEPTVKEPKSDKAYAQYKNFAVSKTNKLVSIKFSSAVANNFLTEQILKELDSCLKELSKDNDCHVVLITSNDSGVFCQGLDYKTLVAKDEDSRRKKAVELSKCVRDFLRCLLNFPKILVAGIEGACVGLSVTMLPLFDMVVANDTATFFTPYASLGCVPEAGFLLTVPHLSSHGLASELLYTSQVLKADDAFRRGLVTRLCWPEKYHEELNSICSDIACQSKQSLMATKSQLRQHIMQSTESSLKSVTTLLIEHWTSAECQKKFDSYKIEVE